MMKRILIVVILLAIPACFGQTQAAKLRMYYIAADEVDWDYAPGGVNKMMGMKFEGFSTIFTERGPHRIGTVYRKALYREYTDDTFTRLKPRSREFLARSCELRSVTRSAFFSRTTLPVRTACIRTASSI